MTHVHDDVAGPGIYTSSGTVWFEGEYSPGASPEQITFMELSGNADFNSDGSVSGEDLVIWQLGNGITSGATLAQGDTDEDGAVDRDDSSLWKAQYPSGVTALTNSQTMPEPATMLLLTLSLLTSWQVRFLANHTQKT